MGKLPSSVIDTNPECGLENTSNSSQDNAFSELRSWSVKNKDKLKIATLNINSLRNKIEDLRELVANNLDIIVVGETKIDASVSEASISIPGFEHKSFRLDRNLRGGGIVTYVREDIPSKRLHIDKLPDDIEGTFIEINLRKAKWIIFAAYLPPWQDKDYFFESVTKALDVYRAKYDNIILVGDFNTSESEQVLSEFLYEQDMSSLVSFPTCFKSVLNPSTIDLFLTNRPKCFQNTIGISSGISDFHKLVATSFKMACPKNKPIEKVYRDMKQFDRDAFRDDLWSKIGKLDEDYESFEDTFLSTLNKYAPIKKKILRANHKPYVTKAMRKAIMKRSELVTKYRKNPTDENLKAWKKQKNYCSNLYKRERKDYYDSLDMKNLTDNRKFWATVKPLFSNSTSTTSNISLVENEKLVTSEHEVAETLNKHFISSVKELVDKDSSSAYLIEECNLDDPVRKIIQKFRLHPSILKIKRNVSNANFSFKPFLRDDILTEISKMKEDKSSTGIPVKILKDNADLLADKLTDILNKCLKTGIFPDKLKLADISPIFKAKDNTSKKNYRPVSVLNTVSKLFEKLLNKQFVTYIDQHLSQYLCGYRKGYSTQYALLSLIEKWKSYRDKGGFSAAILMDLSKAFDTINHELLIAKLHSYGVNDDALKLFWSYLNNRWQRTKINNTFSSWAELLYGVPQGSVLGPLLFNIYINDLFYEITQSSICNFADDTTPHVSGYVLKDVLNVLEQESTILIDWFRDNFMTLNQGKCHLLVSGHKHESVFANIGETRLWEEYCAKLLGIQIDRDLNFKKHVRELCKKAGRKLSMMSRVAKYMSLEKRKINMRTFFESQFTYCPLIWMFCDRGLNRKINHLHERALRIAYNDYDSTFDALLEKDNSVVIHQRNLRSLLIEMYKIHSKISPAFICDLISESECKYQTRSHYKITENTDGAISEKKIMMKIPQVHKVHTGIESFSYIGPKLWNSLPEDVKKLDRLESSKSKW